MRHLRPVDNTEAERPRGLGFVETPGAKRMAEYLTRAVTQHQIGIISGPTGSGKTVRARAWREAQDDPREVSIVPIYEGEGDVKAAVKTLCRAFGIPCDRSGPESWRAEIVYTLRHYPRSRAVILDEAQFLTRPAVGHLRQLVHDEAGVALILMGDTRLPDLLKGLDAITGRALRPFILPGAEAADVRAMAEAARLVGLHDKEDAEAQEAVKDLLRAASGDKRLRIVWQVLDTALRAADGAPLTARHIGWALKECGEAITGKGKGK